MGLGVSSVGEVVKQIFKGVRTGYHGNHGGVQSEVVLIFTFQMEREKRKADKRSNKMTLSELHRKVSQPNGGTSATKNDNLAAPPSPAAERSPSRTVSVNDEADPASVPGEAGATLTHHKVDPATGEKTHHAKASSREDDLSKGLGDGFGEVPDNNSSALTSTPSSGVGGSYQQEALGASSEPPQNNEDSTDTAGNTSDNIIASNYASSGPQTDSPVATVPDAPVLDISDTPEGADGTARCAAAYEDSPHPDNDNPRHDNEVGEQMGGAGPPTGQLNPHSKRKPVAAIQYEKDSVEMSLKDFCTTERLTGDNQFACGQCNARASAAKAEEKARKERERRETVRKEEAFLVENQDVNGNTCTVPDQGSGDKVGRDGEDCAVESEMDERPDGEGSNHHSSVLSHEEMELSDGDLEGMYVMWDVHVCCRTGFSSVHMKCFFIVSANNSATGWL